MTEVAKDSGDNSENESGNSTLERILQAAIEERRAHDEGSASGDKAQAEVAQFAEVILSEVYKGPFQHPEILKKFDNVVPDGAERAFSLTEREQSHRHEVDDRMISISERQVAFQEEETRERLADARTQMRADIQIRKFVIYSGVIFAFLSLIAFVVLIILGFSVAAIGAGGVAVLSAAATGVMVKKSGQ